MSGPEDRCHVCGINDPGHDMCRQCGAEWEDDPPDGPDDPHDTDRNLPTP